MAEEEVVYSFSAQLNQLDKNGGKGKGLRVASFQIFQFYRGTPMGETSPFINVMNTFSADMFELGFINHLKSKDVPSLWRVMTMTTISFLTHHLIFTFRFSVFFVS